MLNPRKHHRRINKTDKADLLYMVYTVYGPTQDPLDLGPQMIPYERCASKLEAFDFIEKLLKSSPTLSWSDFRITKSLHYEIFS